MTQEEARQEILRLLWAQEHEEISWKKMVREIRATLVQVQQREAR